MLIVLFYLIQLIYYFYIILQNCKTLFMYLITSLITLISGYIINIGISIAESILNFCQELATHLRRYLLTYKVRIFCITREVNLVMSFCPSV